MIRKFLDMDDLDLEGHFAILTSMGRLSVLNHQICTKHASWDAISLCCPSVRVSRDVPPFRPPFFTSGTPSGWVYRCKNTPIGYHFFKIEMSKARYYGVDKPIQVSMSQHKTAVTPLLTQWSYHSVALCHWYVHVFFQLNNIYAVWVFVNCEMKSWNYYSCHTLYVHRWWWGIRWCIRLWWSWQDFDLGWFIRLTGSLTLMDSACMEIRYWVPVILTHLDFDCRCSITIGSQHKVFL